MSDIVLDPNQQSSTPELSPPPSPPSSSPKTLPIIIGIAILLASLGIGLFFFTSKSNRPQTQVSQSPSPAPSLQASVTYLTGSAWLMVNDRKTELKESDLVSSNDIIVTDPNSRLTLRFDDGSIVNLDESTRISLSTLLPQNMEIINHQGNLFARVQKDQKHAFTVHAKNYAITAHGTIFAVENQDKLTVSVLESSVEVKNNDQTTTVNQSQQWQENQLPQPLTQNPSEFITWSQQSTESTPTPTPKPTASASPTPAATPTLKPTTSTESSIKLSGSASATDIILNWQTTNISEGGLKILKSTQSNPSYPGSDYKYLDSTNQKQLIWNLQDGNTYHFRVCHYLDGKCQTYSNDITLTAPQSSTTTDSSAHESTGVNSITLTASKDGNQAKLTWSVSGHSDRGYKVVWSDQPDPVYPNRDSDHYHYLDSSSATSDTISDLSSKKYYFRVCEYLSGRCGTYSNQVSLDF